VAFDAAKSYVCKYNRTCNVNITEVDGVKMKGPRCQACRYQACLDNGMYHSGVQRTRGGRHGYSPIKQRSNSIEKYPTIPAPNISAVMASISKKSIHEDQDYNMDPADLVSVSMEDHGGDTVQDQHFLHKSQLWESFASENVRNEVDMLRSRANIAETLLNEKTKQLDIVHKQVEMLKNHLLQKDDKIEKAVKLNKEQAIMIESLKRRLRNQDSIVPTMITQTDIEKYKTNDKNNNKKKDDKIEKTVKLDNNAKKDKAKKSDQNVKGDDNDKKPRKQKNAKISKSKDEKGLLPLLPSSPVIVKEPNVDKKTRPVHVHVDKMIVKKMSENSNHYDEEDDDSKLRCCCF